MTTNLPSRLTPEQREELADRAFNTIANCVDDGHVMFDGDEDDYEVVADGCWVTCRIFVSDFELDAGT